jgi:hypothetical protein
MAHVLEISGPAVEARRVRAAPAHPIRDFSRRA